jgi:predicted glycoside hydrolase/deacetylase ChbG (UPF0249 family)
LLIVNADDYGYSPRYNAGILRAADAGAIDAASAMVLRPWCDPGPLLDSGIAIGLHLELSAEATTGPVRDEPRRQAELFAAAFERQPAHIDGHHHCQAAAPIAAAVEELALALGVRVRSATARHREQLRSRGIETPGRLIGRLSLAEPALPTELESALAGAPLPSGLTEWMVHPGYRDPTAGSGYDAAREEDLDLLLQLAGQPAFRRLRG